MFFRQNRGISLGVVALFVLMLTACHGRPTDIDDIKSDTLTVTEDVPEDSLLLYDDEPEPETADMLFADFFYAFTTDSRYRQQRVAFPLKCADGSAEPLTKADFEQRAAFAPQEFYAAIYDRDTDMSVQSDTALKAVAVDCIHLQSQTIDRYHFQRIQGKWMLTDYETREVSMTPQATFLEFYGQFAADQDFQRDCIQFPLRLVGGAEDGEEEGEVELTEEEWPEFRDQMPLPQDMMTAIDYGQAALSENRKILLMEGASNGLLVKYKFDRTDGRWMLYEIEF